MLNGAKKSKSHKRKKSGKSKTRLKRASKSTRSAKKNKGFIEAQTPNPENDIDGCDVEFLDGVVTPDHQLPVAKGGVETIGGKGRVRSRRPK